MKIRCSKKIDKKNILMIITFFVIFSTAIKKIYLNLQLVLYDFFIIKTLLNFHHVVLLYLGMPDNTRIKNKKISEVANFNQTPVLCRRKINKNNSKDRIFFSILQTISHFRKFERILRNGTKAAFVRIKYTQKIGFYRSRSSISKITCQNTIFRNTLEALTVYFYMSCFNTVIYLEMLDC